MKTCDKWKAIRSGQVKIDDIANKPLKNAYIYCIYFFEPWFKVQTLPILAPYLLNLSSNLFNKTTNFNRRLLGESLIYITKLHIYNKKTVKIH